MNYIDRKRKERNGYITMCLVFICLSLGIMILSACVTTNLYILIPIDVVFNLILFYFVYILTLILLGCEIS